MNHEIQDIKKVNNEIEFIIKTPKYKNPEFWEIFSKKTGQVILPAVSD